MKKLLLDKILNLKRISKFDNRTFHSRRFLYNPHIPIEGIDNSTFDAFKKILQIKSGAVIDVGANIGQTLNNILLIDAKREYIGFEPQTYAAAIIEIFINENNLKDKTIIPIGLSDRFSVEEFYSFGNDLSNFYNTGATIEKKFIDIQEEKCYQRKVILENCDKFLKNLKVKDISVIKIDVEGAEIKVLKGFKETINNKRPFIIFEMLPFSKRSISEEDFLYECNNLIENIKVNNMEIFSIQRSTERKISLFSRSHLDLKNNTRDYVAVPNEFLAEWNKVI